ncbi:MAG: glycosyltransferase [Firmicutes bacterium]|nr:glycosyltransferase [Bacillota bacterium]
MASDTISIIVPVYNVQKYLRECLDSILAQTYSFLDIILIDDGSTDSSGEICDEYAQKDSRIRVFHTANQGISAARNYALDRISGQWVGFVDSDDWIEPDMFEKLLNAAIFGGTPIAACSRSIDYVGSYTTFDRSDSPAVLRTLNEIAEGYFTGRMLGNVVWERIYRREVFDSGIRFPVGRIYEDISISTAIITGGWTISYIPDLLYHYRQRKTSSVHDRGLKKWADNWDAVYEQMNALYDLVPGYRKYLIWNCAYAAGNIWEKSVRLRKKERKPYNDLYKEVCGFSAHVLDGSDRNSLRTKDRITLTIARRSSFPAFLTMYIIRRVNALRSIRKQKETSRLFD